MRSIVSMGIIPSNTVEGNLTDCMNVMTKPVSVETYACSRDNLDNAALVEYFNTNCVGAKDCEINMSSFVIDDPTSICNL